MTCGLDHLFVAADAFQHCLVWLPRPSLWLGGKSIVDFFKLPCFQLLSKGLCLQPQMWVALSLVRRSSFSPSRSAVNAEYRNL